MPYTSTFATFAKRLLFSVKIVIRNKRFETHRMHHYINFPTFAIVEWLNDDYIHSTQGLSFERLCYLPSVILIWTNHWKTFLVSCFFSSLSLRKELFTCYLIESNAFARSDLLWFVYGFYQTQLFGGCKAIDISISSVILQIVRSYDSLGAHLWGNLPLRWRRLVCDCASSGQMHSNLNTLL